MARLRASSLSSIPLPSQSVGGTLYRSAILQNPCVHCVALTPPEASSRTVRLPSLTSVASVASGIESTSTSGASGQSLPPATNAVANGLPSRRTVRNSLERLRSERALIVSVAALSGERSPVKVASCGLPDPIAGRKTDSRTSPVVVAKATRVWKVPAAICVTRSCPGVANWEGTTDCSYVFEPHAATVPSGRSTTVCVPPEAMPIASSVPPACSAGGTMH